MLKEEISLNSSSLLPTLSRRSLRKSPSQPKQLRQPPKQLVKQLEQRISMQKQEIDRHDMIVQMLTMQFEQLKEQAVREQERSLIMQNKNKQLEERYTRLQNEHAQIRKAYSDLLEKRTSSPRPNQSPKRKATDKDKESLADRVKELEESQMKLTEELADKERQLKETDEDKLRVADLVELYLVEMAAVKDKNSSLSKNVEELSSRNKQLSKERYEAQRRLAAESANDRVIRLQQENDQLKSSLEGMKQRIHNGQQQITQVIADLQTKLRHKTKELKTLKINELLPLHKKLELVQAELKQMKVLIHQHLDLLKEKEQELSKLLMCRLCHRFMTEAVSVVPCGHSYCRTCRKGYEPQCYKCGPKRKSQGVYRNEFVDQAKDLFQLLHSFETSLSKATPAVEPND